jgi:putative transposase
MKHTEALYPNQYYHLYNHAVGRDNFFNHDDNYRYFLKKYTHYIYPICQTFAYCLMPNHFHFLVRVRGEEVLFNQAQTLQPGKVLAKAEFSYPEFAMQQFSNFFNSYTKAYNKVYQRRGALFVDYLKRRRVEGEAYFTRLIHYIHYNPVHHQFCQNVAEWPYSSYQAVLSQKESKIEKEAVLAWFGGPATYRALHQTAPEMI